MTVRFCLPLLLAALVTDATEIVMRSGAVFNGTVVSQTESFIILESAGSRITIAKNLIARIDGTPYPGDAAGAERTPLSHGAESRFILGAEVTLTLTNGTKLKGKIFSENENFIVLHVGNSRLNIAKGLIEEVDGRKISPAKKSESPATVARDETYVPEQSAKKGSTLAPVAPSLAQPAGIAATIPTAVQEGTVSSSRQFEHRTSTVSDRLPQPLQEPAPSANAQPVVVIAKPQDSINQPRPVRADTLDIAMAHSAGSILLQGAKPFEVTIVHRSYDDSSSVKAPDLQYLLDGTDTTLATLMNRLRSRVPDRRMAAVVTLGILGERAAAAADLLVGLLLDTALYLPSGGDSSPVLKNLPSPTSVSDQAARSLLRIGQGTLKALLRGMRSPSWVMRAQTAFVLGEMRAVEGARPLVDALRDTSLTVCNVAVEALVKIGDPRFLFGVLRSRDAEQKKYAIEALARMRDPKAVEPLIRALSDKDSYVREKAAYALGEIRDARAIDALCESLNDNISFVRANAVEALGKIGDPRVMGRLGTVLRDPSNYVQEKAHQVAKQLAAVEFKRYKENTELLIEALKEPDPQIREKAAQTLWILTGKEYGTDYQRWRSWLSSGEAGTDSLNTKIR